MKKSYGNIEVGGKWGECMERGQVQLQGKEQAGEEAGVPWGLGLAPGSLQGLQSCCSGG